MILSLAHRTKTKTSIFNILSTTLLLDSAHQHGPNIIFTTTQFHSLHQRRRRTKTGQQMWWLPSGSSLSLSRMFHSSLNCSFNRSYCKIPLFLSHPSSFLVLQKKLLNPHLGYSFYGLPFSSFQGKFMFLDNYRPFCSVSGVESDSEGGGSC